VVNSASLLDRNATTLQRGLSILFALSGEAAADSGGLGVVRIAEVVGSEKSQVSRTLKTLASLGLVERDPDTRAYRLGWRLFSLAAQAGDRRLLVAARPVLAHLIGVLGETVHLSVLRGTDVLTVLSETPPRSVHAASWLGHTVPASCSSAGRALLLDHGPDELAALFGHSDLPRPGPNAPRDVAELGRRVAEARARGSILVEEELEPGLVGAAAPLRDFSGRIVAALNISGPKFRFDEHLEAAAQEVRAAAARLSAALGFHPDAADGRRESYEKTQPPAAQRKRPGKE
jgi:DNA-binding IclR family transcriptional regulator